MNSTKKLKEGKYYFIEFTEDEITEMGVKSNEKFSIEFDDKTGVILLTPYAKMDIDLDALPRELLEIMIIESCEKDISINEVIQGILEKAIEKIDSPSFSLEKENRKKIKRK